MIMKSANQKSPEIEYSIVRAKRVKTSEIIVGKDEVIVRTPSNKPIHEIEEIIRKKASWIAKKQDEYRKQVPPITKPRYVPGSTLPYFGINYPLTIMIGKGKANRIRFFNNEFLVSLESDATVADRKKTVRSLYEKWLAQIASRLLIERVDYYAKKVGVAPKQVNIKLLRRRWGSASKAGVISLNANLVKAPRLIMDYIILHELCHLRIRDHSHHYWDLLHKFMPSYSDSIEWLRLYGASLLDK